MTSTNVSNWVSEPDGRGTWGILSSCVLTIILCCWSSVYPNVPSRSDGEYKQFLYKFYLLSVGILGPEILLFIALGQWTSARISKKGYTDWTMTHSFFADMGGFLLAAPGSELFPIDAEQLLHLVRDGYLVYPGLDAEDIKDKSKSDRFTSFLAIIQAMWFFINCIGRVAQHIFLTTLELTTLTFILIFLFTSYYWYHKPKDVTRAIVLTTHTPITAIRARYHPYPESKWYQTPLDFLSRNEWYCSRLWRYYVQILHYLRIPLFLRPTSRPYDRFPSDNFLYVDKLAEWMATPVIVFYSCMFMFAWNFSFPTLTEQLLWRISAAYLVLFGTAGMCVCWHAHVFIMPKLAKEKKFYVEGQSLDLPTKKGLLHRLAWRLQNIHPDRDPELDVPLKVLLPNVLMCVVLCVSRYYSGGGFHWIEELA
ncbi:hypothetical protein TSTA_126340 [Talaromyces stipitatus ATCC 10500]|uniref:Uncharacterized protein n=1 Tax=Talaromyces stipitatus (strain ATCC 10500 / CBS 375.48 / QM 6759 / NRRL 1006) TaxID=441959 RepID=B8MBD7_TALSN|nr:uncharacterized protein TSTA_126340 [Talaromyces stipitatus ATCC 10500]EED18926.1 hypothetical protein TSTA_126340 [Talaromyces stipitatus ATCC 10500]